MLQATPFAVRAFSGIRITLAVTRTRAVARRVLCTRRDTAKCVGFSALLDSHELHFNRHAKANRLRYTRVRRDRPQVKADSGQPASQKQQPRDGHGGGHEGGAERGAVTTPFGAKAAQRLRHGRKPPRGTPTPSVARPVW